jgi:uncharacterized protein YjbJ (UPF0337 family)
MADDARGKGTHLGGKVKEGIGDLLGDRELKREGRLDQVEGEAEQDQARAQEAEREALERKAAAREAKRQKEI